VESKVLYRDGKVGTVKTQVFVNTLSDNGGRGR